MTGLTVLFVTAFVDMVGLAMIVPLLPFYATDLGASATVVGLLVSAFSVAQLAVAPLWGRFSDRYGRRPAILAGLLLTAVRLCRLWPGPLGAGPVAFPARAGSGRRHHRGRPGIRGRCLASRGAHQESGLALRRDQPGRRGRSRVRVAHDQPRGEARPRPRGGGAGDAGRRLRRSLPGRIAAGRDPTSHSASTTPPAPGDRPRPFALARAGVPTHLDLHDRHRGLLRHYPGGAAPAHEPTGRQRAERRLFHHVPGRNGRGGPLAPAGPAGGLSGRGATVAAGTRSACGGSRLHRFCRARRPSLSRLHPDAARNRVPLPLRHRTPLTSGAEP